MMRDEEFCQRLRQIRQKYGYGDQKAKTPQVGHQEYSRKLSVNQSFTAKPNSYEQPMDLPRPTAYYQPNHSREVRVESARPQRMTSVHEVSFQGRSFRGAEEPQKPSLERGPQMPSLERGPQMPSLERGLQIPRTSMNYEMKFDYPGKNDPINSSPIRRIKEELHLDASPYKEMSPVKTNMPVLALSPYNRVKTPIRERQAMAKGGSAGASRRGQRDEMGKENPRQFRGRHESQVVEDKYSYNIKSIDSVQSKINSVLGRAK